jgi:hypothetical protein
LRSCCATPASKRSFTALPRARDHHKVGRGPLRSRATSSGPTLKALMRRSRCPRRESCSGTIFITSWCATHNVTLAAFKTALEIEWLSARSILAWRNEEDGQGDKEILSQNILDVVAAAYVRPGFRQCVDQSRNAADTTSSPARHSRNVRFLRSTRSDSSLAIGWAPPISHRSLADFDWSPRSQQFKAPKGLRFVSSQHLL